MIITDMDKLTLDENCFINGDCMEGMKRLPDKCIDLAIVDPPYGSGGANGQALNGSAGDLTSTARVPRGGVAREAEIQTRCTSKRRTSDSQTGHGVMRTGGTWAARYAKKSLRGTQRRGKNTFKNFSVSHGIR